jgi:hypothetical protein
MRDFDSFEEKLMVHGNSMLVKVVIRCMKELFALKDKNAELEKRIEALEAGHEKGTDTGRN